ncbi:hypothetical protein ACIQXI_10995 [Lysinibacillus sp. NPDC097195]|uniref:hypothetical protein n=1 Tax=Lysinibacillus sp. NPDC097195 TaxID=3364141 RepID=UPI0038136C03
MIIIKKFGMISLVLAFFFISACSGTEAEHYSSKEESLNSFIEKEDIKGDIDLILTKSGEELLVVQSKEDVFFVAELIENKEGYYAERISDSVVLGIGASWELNTVGKNKYTIYFDKNKKDLNFISLSNGEHKMSLVEGHTITKNSTELTNAIKEVEVIKD